MSEQLIEIRMKTALLAAVSQRKRKLRLLKAVSVATVVFAAMNIIVLSNGPQSQGGLVTNSNSMESSTSTVSVMSGSISLDSPNPPVEYVARVWQVEYIPTIPLGVTIVTDEELESTFADRAYAVLPDQDNNITEFHLLNASIEQIE